MADKVLLYAPIEKTDEDKRMVYGYASTEALDSQGEIVKKDALQASLTDYMQFANIREMHQPSAVGKTKKAQLDKKGLYISVKVVDDKAWEKVKEGVYNGFSIGGRVTEQVGNEITGLKLSEISLVDRPANPEALFDVFKADDVKKDVYGASFLVSLACDLSMYIESEKFESEDTNDLERALKSIKAALVDEIKEPEYFETIGDRMPLSDAVAAAEQVLDLAKKEKVTKADEDKKEEVVEEEKVEETVETETEEVKEEAPIEVDKDIEPAVETKVEDLEEEKDTLAEEVKSEEEPKEELVEESPAEEEKVEKTPMEKVAEKLHELKMPNDDEIKELLVLENQEVSERTIGVLKYELAGKIIDNISKSMKSQEAKDLAEWQAKKTQDKIGIVLGEKTAFDGVYKALDKLSELTMTKSTSSEVTVPPQATESPASPAEVNSKVLEMLNEVVKLISSTNQGGQLTDEEKERAENGSQDGSTFSGEGKFDPENVVEDPVKDKAEQPKDLSKIEGMLKEAMDQIEKFKQTPEPVRIKAGYLIEKFEETDDSKGELEKAEKESLELQKVLAGPHDAVDETKAAALAAKIMKLRREVAA